MQNLLAEELIPLYGTKEASAITGLLFEGYLGWNSKQVLMNKEHHLSESDILKFLFALKRLKKHEPVQYVLGYAWFDDMKLNVAPGVLIPRQETEELVALVAKGCNGHEKILDVGTGSGCIALSLKKQLPASQVYGLDNSLKALDIATANAKKQNLNVEFIHADILDEVNWKSLPTYDVVVSNPPYVLESEKTQMQPNVLEHEPHSALFVESSSPVIYFETIGKFAVKHLTASGQLYFEINENKGDEVSSCLQKLGFVDIKVENDLNDKPRFVHATLG